MRFICIMIKWQGLRNNFIASQNQLDLFKAMNINVGLIFWSTLCKMNNFWCIFQSPRPFFFQTGTFFLYLLFHYVVKWRKWIRFLCYFYLIVVNKSITICFADNNTLQNCILTLSHGLYYSYCKQQLGPLELFR